MLTIQMYINSIDIIVYLIGKFRMTDIALIFKEKIYSTPFTFIWRM
jgi:hypothetical protein